MTEGGLSWLSSGGSDTSKASSSLNSSCFGIASRTSPLAFEGDSRGRLQNLCTKLLSKRRCDYEHIKVERYPLYLGYVSESATSSTVCFRVERLAVPKKAAVVELDPWLSEETRGQWNDPVADKQGSEEIASSHFAATQREWRWALR
eukprot:4302124-Amphidinium_carterae.1